MRSEVSLAPYLSYRIGGPAEFFLEVRGDADIPVALEFASQANLPVHVLGNGTNVLVRDGGLRGLVLYLGARPFARDVVVLEETPDEVRLRASAFCAKAALLDMALEKNWSGLEFSAGIPGSLGGAVYMNAGTKWGNYASVIERVRFYQKDRGFFEMTRDEIGFKYRGVGEGLFTDGRIVLSLELRLGRNKSADQILREVDEILEYRGQRQPLEMPNCGSVFKNPANSEKGAGRLIEACGLKGMQMGGARVSDKHANFILNVGGATSNDVEGVIAEVQRQVEAKFHVLLEKEVIVMGVA